MRRLTARLGRRPERRSLWAVVLLLLALLGIGLAVATVVRGLDGGLVFFVVVLAALLGWGLATSPLTTRQGFLVASLAGTVALLVRVARLGDLLWEMIRASLAAGWAAVDPAPDAVPPQEILSQALLRLTSGLETVFSRIAAWVRALPTGDPAYDPLAVALAWSLFLWGAAAWAAWATRRYGRPLLGILPALMVGTLAIRYTGGSWALLLVPLAAALMLMAFADHDARHRRWDAAGIGLPEGLGATLAQSAVPVALGLVVAGTLAPSLSVQEAVRVLQRLRSQPETQEDRVARSLGLEPQSPSGSGLHNPRSSGLPNRHLIGSGPELAANLVMTAVLTGLPFEAPTPEYYWRGLTYDRYLGRGWGTSPTVTWEYRAGEPTTPEVPPSHRVIRQRILAQVDLGGLAYTAGTLAVLDQEYQVAWRSASLDLLGAFIDSTDYEVESLVPIADPTQLASARSGYPEWIQERYLDLPDDLPDRVVALARDLTATAATPFDRAVALETYLREFPYNLDVPDPPLQRDVVDWFLFDLKQGYCDYYATAMAVLARAAGLPARLVVGFYTGTAERSEGVIRYLVTEADSHSWVEIYFPGMGWIEFEPTAGRAAIDRSEAAALLPDLPPGPARLEIATSAAAARWRGLITNTLRVTGAGLLLIGGTAVAWILSDRWRLGRLSHQRAVAVLYRRLFQSAERLGLIRDPGTTPHEFARTLEKTTRMRPGRAPWAGVLSPVISQVRQLIDLEVRTAFSPTPPGPDEVKRAVRHWSRLNRRLWLSRILAAATERWPGRLDRSSTRMVQDDFLGSRAREKEVAER